jgi:F-type H+-transporting ATPase subunit delta
MQNPRLAARYAKSLLDLAIEQNQLETTLMDVQLIDAICAQSREFASMLRSPIINADKKQVIIEAVLGHRLAPLTKAFVTLLVSKGRESNLPEIGRAFVTQYKAMKNIRTVKLTTAAPISDAVKETIRAKAVASLKGSTVEIEEKVNPELIGGFVLEMDDKLFDASIRRDLNDVRKQFLQNIYISQMR